jgi:hypothetical protein
MGIKQIKRSIAALGAAALLLGGCSDTPQPSSYRGSAGPKNPTREVRGEILVGTMETLFHLDDYELGQAEQLVMSRLNQWLKGQEIKTSWQREPRLAQLPQSLTNIREVEWLDRDSFLYEHDFAFLREAVWLHRIADDVRRSLNAGTQTATATSDQSATSSADNGAPTANAGYALSPLRFTTADDPEELRLAERLFDWTVRNVQLENDQWPQNGEYKLLPQHWHTPYESVLLGRGTASDRAWVFMLLARQQGLDVVMLGLGNAEEPGKLKTWIPALLLSQREGAESATDLYLFDPALGLPIPGPKRRGIATLAQAATDESVLRQLDLDDKKPYPVKAAELAEVTALAEASPGYLSRRMQFLESRLGGDQRITLTTSLDNIEKKLATAKHVRPKLAVWTRPYETLHARETDDDNVQNVARAELFPLQGLLRPIDAMSTDRKAVTRREDAPEWGDAHKRSSRGRLRVPLGVGRMLQLAGDFGHESGAIRYLQQAMATDIDQDDIMQVLLEELRAQSGRTNDPAMQQRLNQIARAQVQEFRRADQAAKLWIGQIKAEQGEYPTAISYFTSWENPVWQPSINYSLARVYEVQGKLSDAIRVYREDDSPQRSGNLLRARWLEIM